MILKGMFHFQKKKTQNQQLRHQKDSFVGERQGNFTHSNHPMLACVKQDDKHLDLFFYKSYH